MIGFQPPPFALVCAMNRFFPCQTAAHLSQSRVFRACSARGREPFFVAVRARKQRFFAPGLVAEKPEKPCDGGVFGALNSLLISERASDKASGIPFSTSAARTQARPGASQNPARRLISFRPPPFALVCAMDRALPCPDCGASAASRVFRACSARSVNRSLPPSALPKTAFFRSCCDSSQARQTVRWERFWGLEFAPDFGAGKERQGGLDSVQHKRSPNPNPRTRSTEPARRSIGFRPPPFALVRAMNRALLCPACGASAEKPRFQSLFSAGPRTVFCRRPAPETAFISLLV